MVNIVGFVQGRKKSDEYWRQKSTEALAAYNNFKAQNPDSTVDQRMEYQQLLADGMSFVGRMMPNKDVVGQNVSAQTTVRKDQADQRARAAATAERARQDHEYKINTLRPHQALMREMQLEQGILSIENANAQKKLTEVNTSDEAIALKEAELKKNKLDLRLDYLKTLVDSGGIPKDDPETSVREDFDAYYKAANKMGFGENLLNLELFTSQFNKLELERTQKEQADALTLSAAQKGAANQLQSTFQEMYLETPTITTSDLVEKYKKANPESPIDNASLTMVATNAKASGGRVLADMFQSAANDWANKGADRGSLPALLTSKYSPKDQAVLDAIVNSAEDSRINSQIREASTNLKQKIITRQPKTKGEADALIEELKTEYPVLTGAHLTKLNTIINGEMAGINKSIENFQITRNDKMSSIVSGVEVDMNDKKFITVDQALAAFDRDVSSQSGMNYTDTEIAQQREGIEKMFDAFRANEANFQDQSEKKASKSAVKVDANAYGLSATAGLSFDAMKKSASTVAVNRGYKDDSNEVTTLVSEYSNTATKIKTLSYDFGIPANNNFIQSTLNEIYLNGDPAMSIEPSDATILDAIEKNIELSITPETLSMGSYMSEFRKQYGPTAKLYHTTDSSKNNLYGMGGVWKIMWRDGAGDNPAIMQSHYDDLFNVVGETATGDIISDLPSLRSNLYNVADMHYKNIDESLNAVNDIIFDVNDTVRSINSEIPDSDFDPSSLIDHARFSEHRSSIEESLIIEMGGIQTMIREGRSDIALLDKQLDPSSFYGVQQTSNLEGGREVGTTEDYKKIQEEKALLTKRFIKLQEALPLLGNALEKLQNSNPQLPSISESEILTRYQDAGKTQNRDFGQILGQVKPAVINFLQANLRNNKGMQGIERLVSDLEERLVAPYGTDGGYFQGLMDRQSQQANPNVDIKRQRQQMLYDAIKIAIGSPNLNSQLPYETNRKLREKFTPQVTTFP